MDDGSNKDLTTAQSIEDKYQSVESWATNATAAEIGQNIVDQSYTHAANRTFKLFKSPYHINLIYKQMSEWRLILGKFMIGVVDEALFSKCIAEVFDMCNGWELPFAFIRVTGITGNLL